ncbi:MAG: hydrolase [Solirubrobacterales bacterium]|nr:hydrolase [Solirubrobacterales bacterium]
MSSDGGRGGPVEREFSAGGVVVRSDAGGVECVVIVPTRRAKGGERVLALPKGHPEQGESGADAALREIREETGIEAALVDKLGDVRYWYQRDGKRIAKVVTFFLFEYVSGDPGGDPFEVDETRWMPLAEAERALSYRGEREMVSLAKVHPACRS